MDSYEIWGGRKLMGEVDVSGAKNAVLPILAASVMIPGTTVLDHCPDLSDVRAMCEILEYLGCEVTREEERLRVDASRLHCCSIPDHMMKRLRSSVFLAGPLLARCRQAVISGPGGCAIGARPIDLHFHGLSALGARIRQRRERIYCIAPHLSGTEIELTYPSVGATENIMMAASLAKGITVLKNAAREPEIVDLQNFLISCGAKIAGAGTSEIQIEGVSTLHPSQYRIMGDRIEGGTYLMAAAITAGAVTVRGLDPSWLPAELDVLERMGCDVTRGNRNGEPFVSLKGPEVLRSPGVIRAEPWPGFSTDLQSPLLALCSRSEGTTVIEDTVFERRFQCAEELKKLGSEISCEGGKLTVKGNREPVGGAVAAGDLRGGAALVIAALGNPGRIIVENICHINRGYGKFDIVLNKLGACIEKRETYGRETTGISEKQTKKKEEKEKALSVEVHDFCGFDGGALFSADIASV